MKILACFQQLVLSLLLVLLLEVWAQQQQLIAVPSNSIANPNYRLVFFNQQSSTLVPSLPLNKTAPPPAALPATNFIHHVLCNSLLFTVFNVQQTRQLQIYQTDIRTQISTSFSSISPTPDVAYNSYEITISGAACAGDSFYLALLFQLNAATANVTNIYQANIATKLISKIATLSDGISIPTFQFKSVSETSNALYFIYQQTPETYLIKFLSLSNLLVNSLAMIPTAVTPTEASTSQMSLLVRKYGQLTFIHLVHLHNNMLSLFTLGYGGLTNSSSSSIDFNRESSLIQPGALRIVEAMANYAQLSTGIPQNPYILVTVDGADSSLTWSFMTTCRKDVPPEIHHVNVTTTSCMNVTVDNSTLCINETVDRSNNTLCINDTVDNSTLCANETTVDPSNSTCVNTTEVVCYNTTSLQVVEKPKCFTEDFSNFKITGFIPNNVLTEVDLLIGPSRGGSLIIMDAFHINYLVTDTIKLVAENGETIALGAAISLCKQGSSYKGCIVLPALNVPFSISKQFRLMLNDDSSHSFEFTYYDKELSVQQITKTGNPGSTFVLSGSFIPNSRSKCKFTVWDEAGFTTLLSSPVNVTQQRAECVLPGSVQLQDGTQRFVYLDYAQDGQVFLDAPRSVYVSRVVDNFNVFHFTDFQTMPSYVAYNSLPTIFQGTSKNKAPVLSFGSQFAPSGDAADTTKGITIPGVHNLLNSLVQVDFILGNSSNLGFKNADVLVELRIFQSSTTIGRFYLFINPFDFMDERTCNAQVGSLRVSSPCSLVYGGSYSLRISASRTGLISVKIIDVLGSKVIFDTMQTLQISPILLQSNSFAILQVSDSPKIATVMPFVYLDTVVLKCNPYYSGEDCSTLICNDKGGCGANAVCVGPNKCYCNSHWISLTPDNRTCIQPVCDSCVSGVCSAPNNCTCWSGYWGYNCSTLCTCKAANTAECKQSTGACVCKPGFSGPNCECNQYQDYAGGTCVCKAGYSGSACTQCDYKRVCNAKGLSCTTSTGKPVCVCETGYIGDLCESCEDKIFCNGRGACNNAMKTYTNTTVTAVVSTKPCNKTVGNTTITTTCQVTEYVNTTNTYSVSGFNCSCISGYSGTNCQVYTATAKFLTIFKDRAFIESNEYDIGWDFSGQFSLVALELHFPHDKSLSKGLFSSEKLTNQLKWRVPASLTDRLSATAYLRLILEGTTVIKVESDPFLIVRKAVQLGLNIDFDTTFPSNDSMQSVDISDSCGAYAVNAAVFRGADSIRKITTVPLNCKLTAGCNVTFWWRTGLWSDVGWNTHCYGYSSPSKVSNHHQDLTVYVTYINSSNVIVKRLLQSLPVSTISYSWQPSAIYNVAPDSEWAYLTFEQTNHWGYAYDIIALDNIIVNGEATISPCPIYDSLRPQFKQVGGVQASMVQLNPLDSSLALKIEFNGIWRYIGTAFAMFTRTYDSTLAMLQAPNCLETGVAYMIDRSNGVFLDTDKPFGAVHPFTNSWYNVTARGQCLYDVAAVIPFDHIQQCADASITALQDQGGSLLKFVMYMNQIAPTKQTNLFTKQESKYQVSIFLSRAAGTQGAAIVAELLSVSIENGFLELSFVISFNGISKSRLRAPEFLTDGSSHPLYLRSYSFSDDKIISRFRSSSEGTKFAGKANFKFGVCDTLDCTSVTSSYFTLDYSVESKSISIIYNYAGKLYVKPANNDPWNLQSNNPILFGNADTYWMFVMDAPKGSPISIQSIYMYLNDGTTRTRVNLFPNADPGFLFIQILLTSEIVPYLITNPVVLFKFKAEELPRKSYKLEIFSKFTISTVMETDKSFESGIASLIALQETPVIPLPTPSSKPTVVAIGTALRPSLMHVVAMLVIALVLAM